MKRARSKQLREHKPAQNLLFTLEEVNMANRPAGKPASSAGENLTEKIKQRAYEKFMKRGYQHGHEMEDWLSAEKEIKAGK
jgi:hypothetical protein